MTSGGPNESPPKAPASGSLRGILTALWLFAVLPSGFVALLAGMLFDAPGSESSPLTVALGRTMFTWPLAWIAGAGLPWVFRRNAFGIWLFLLPLLHMGVAAGLMIAIQVLCDGKLACTKFGP